MMTRTRLATLLALTELEVASPTSGATQRDVFVQIATEARRMSHIFSQLLDAAGDAAPATVKRWWTKDPAFDAEIRARFGELYRAVAAGEHEHWRDSGRGAISYGSPTFKRNGKKQQARRYVYELCIGPIPLEHRVTTTCGEARCVRRMWDIHTACSSAMGSIPFLILEMARSKV